MTLTAWKIAACGAFLAFLLQTLVAQQASSKLEQCRQIEYLFRG